MQNAILLQVRPIEQTCWEEIFFENRVRQASRLPRMGTLPVRRFMWLPTRATCCMLRQVLLARTYFHFCQSTILRPDDERCTESILFLHEADEGRAHRWFGSLRHHDFFPDCFHKEMQRGRFNAAAIYRRPVRTGVAAFS